MRMHTAGRLCWNLSTLLNVSRTNCLATVCNSSLESTLGAIKFGEIQFPLPVHISHKSSPFLSETSSPFATKANTFAMAQDASTAFVGKTFPEGPGKETPLGPLAKDIFPHILNLYNGKPKAADFEIYAPDGIFEDPLMRAQGVPQIKSAFYSLPKLFSVSRMVEYSVEESETAPGSGSGQIRVDNKQHYQVAGREFDTLSLIVLDVQDGKVIRHEDRWNHKPLKGWLGVFRRANMGLTHVLMGFGKDPKET